MTNAFFDHLILNSPYAAKTQHWELAAAGQFTQQTLDSRCPDKFMRTTSTAGLIPRFKQKSKWKAWATFNSDISRAFDQPKSGLSRSR